MSELRTLTVARAAAIAASSVINSLSDKIATGKEVPANISTEADRAAQDIILRTISEAFPTDAFRAEEKTQTLASLPQQGRRMWIIDPIDGTRGFVMKNGEFSVMIALVSDGKLALGVVAEPAHGRQVFAVRGSGCWRQDGDDAPRQVKVTSTSTLAESTLIQSHVKPGRAPSREITAIGPRTIVETYSAGVKLARVADGTVDLYVCDYSTLNDWDLAAGHILVEEAGGRVSTMSGQPLRYGLESPEHSGGLLATNGRLHEATVSALARA